MSLKFNLESKKAVIFSFDNVLYPEKDYLLQVYYLFSEFLAYAEQLDSTMILQFMQTEFTQFGSENIFEKTASQFGIPKRYLENFLLLHETARLPLKLLMFESVLQFMKDLTEQKKQIILLVDGNPLQQLNKIKQLEWHGLKKDLKVYFTEEFEAKPSVKVLDFIINEHNFAPFELALVGCEEIDEKFALQNKIDFISINLIL
jgi:FMN phosphatase YigB (HAD superfamily)